MPDSPDRAIAAALDWLVVRDAPESAVAAHEFGRAESPEPARRWVRWIVDRERNGSWNDDLGATVRSLLLIRELREAASLREQDPAVGRALDWVRSRQGAPGAWTDGCTPERHRRGWCHHFAGGFYGLAGELPADDAPAAAAVTAVTVAGPGEPDEPTDDVPAGVDLPEGARTAGDAETRFALSATALRCTLLWRGGGTDARLHLEVLRRVVRGWESTRPEGLTTTGLLAAARVLVVSPAPSDREAATEALEMVAGHQRGDGSWVDADPFHALAVFTEALESGIGSTRVATAVDYGAQLLAATQHEDGSWGPEHGARRALIGLRALRRWGQPTPGS